MARLKSEQKPKVSIADVATSAGVSKVAVSYVLNNRRGEVGVETRQRIMQAIRELGYRPPPSKAALDRGRCNVIGLVAACEAVEMARTSYHNAVFQGMLDQIAQSGVHITLFAGDMFEVDTADKVRSYCDGRCDGLILLGLRLESPLPRVLDERGIPYVIIGDPREIPGAITVDVDHEHGMHQLVDHLMELGHKRIGFIGGPSFVPAAEIRLGIFRRIARERRFKSFELHTINSTMEDPTNEWISDIMTLPLTERPTAFIVWNDRFADIAVRRLIGIGVRVPQELSIVRFDDMDNMQDVPPLTSYRQPCADIGRRAIQMCLERFDNTGVLPRVELMPGLLVVRGSSGPAPTE